GPLCRGQHQDHPRQAGPFVGVDLGGRPKPPVGRQPFRAYRGGIPGATDSRIGRFEAAHHGTIFIDEIGDFKLESQAKLLRVLENRTITPIGSNDDREVNVRVVAATSRNLERMVKDEDFREDLYYRLNVVNLRIPPLRERREDIPLLVNHFLEQLCETAKKPFLKVSPDLKNFLE